MFTTLYFLEYSPNLLEYTTKSMGWASEFMEGSGNGSKTCLPAETADIIESRPSGLFA